MGVRNSADGWGWPARLMHWAMAALVLFMLGLGFYIAEILTGTDPDVVLQRFLLTQTHKSWGTVAAALVCIRLAWRAVNRAPDMPGGMSAVERLAARCGHAALYACLIAMPVTGWLMASASPLQDTFGVKNMVFGWVELPDPFVPGSAELEAVLRNIHFAIGLTLTALVAVHIAAALKHHFRDRDRTLKRMIVG